jgi:hypothetical protein
MAFDEEELEEIEER